MAAMTTNEATKNFAGKMNGKEIAEYWPQIQEMLLKVPHTWPHHTIESLYNNVVADRIQVWGVGTGTKVNMVLFTQIACHASGNVLEVIWAGGDKVLGEIDDVVDAAFERFAQYAQCRAIHIFGRDGWERHLKSRGFKKIAIVLERKVQPTRTH